MLGACITLDTHLVELPAFRSGYLQAAQILYNMKYDQRPERPPCQRRSPMIYLPCEGIPENPEDTLRSPPQLECVIRPSPTPVGLEQRAMCDHLSKLRIPHVYPWIMRNCPATLV